MKITIFIKLILFFVASTILVSCVNDDDFNVPKNLGEQENKALQQLLDSLYTPNNGYNFVSIQNLKDRFDNNYSKPLKIQNNDVLKGYVTSSDAKGNFYKEIFIQDNSTAPKMGIKIALNALSTYNQFNIGREVYIHLKGLYVGETKYRDNTVAIGGKMNEKGGIETLSTKQIKDFVFRSQFNKTLEPLGVRFSEITKSHVGLYVKFENAEFTEDILGEEYVNPYDDYDSKRILQSCEGDKYVNFILETSTFASFRNEKLPQGGGSITGIINYDYEGENLVLVLNSTADVNFNTVRCKLSE